MILDKRQDVSAEDLYYLIADLAPSVDPQAALQLGGTHWPYIAERMPNPHDAESCRLLALAAVEDRAFERADVWRNRALARFACIGWHEGVGAVAMGDAFKALARANQDFPDGRTLDRIRGSRTAVDLMDELEVFIRVPPSGFSVSKRSPSQALLTRFLHEKRGFLLLVLGRLDEARRSYERAATAVEDNPRGLVKVQLGSALVDYLAGNSTTGLAVTRIAVEEARALDEWDLVSIGEHNVRVMELSGRDLRPYEIL